MMKRSKEERQQRKEQKQKEREFRKELKVSVKRQLRAGRKTARSLGIYAFDPSGIFQMTDGRWIRFYQVSKTGSDPDYSELFGTLPCVTGIHQIHDGNSAISSQLIINFTITAENLIEAQRSFASIEQRMAGNLSFMPIPPFRLLSSIFPTEEENIKQVIKRRRDLRKEFLPEGIPTEHGIRTGSEITSVYRIIQFGDQYHPGMFKAIKETSDCTRFRYIITPMSSMELMDYQRMIETKYNRFSDIHISENINLSIQFSVTCDSLDDLFKAKQKIASICLTYGCIAAEVYSDQIPVYDSLRTFGLTDTRDPFMVNREVVNQMLSEIMEEQSDVNDEV